jgi:hypothetical protein
MKNKIKFLFAAVLSFTSGAKTTGFSSLSVEIPNTNDNLSDEKITDSAEVLEMSISIVEAKVAELDLTATTISAEELVDRSNIADDIHRIKESFRELQRSLIPHMEKRVLNFDTPPNSPGMLERSNSPFRSSSPFRQDLIDRTSPISSQLKNFTLRLDALMEKLDLIRLDSPTNNYS